MTGGWQTECFLGWLFRMGCFNHDSTTPNSKIIIVPPCHPLSPFCWPDSLHWDLFENYFIYTFQCLSTPSNDSDESTSQREIENRRTLGLSPYRFSPSFQPTGKSQTKTGSGFVKEGGFAEVYCQEPETETVGLEKRGPVEKRCFLFFSDPGFGWIKSTLHETITPLKIGHPERKQSYSNHSFSVANLLLVSGRVSHSISKGHFLGGCFLLEIFSFTSGEIDWSLDDYFVRMGWNP